MSPGFGFSHAAHWQLSSLLLLSPILFFLLSLGPRPLESKVIRIKVIILLHLLPVAAWNGPK